MSTKPWCHVVWDTLNFSACMLDGINVRLHFSGAVVWSSMPCHDHAYERRTGASSPKERTDG